jgi:hypothetical protein
MSSIPNERNQPDFEEVRRQANEFACQAYPDVFAQFERIRTSLDVNVPIVSAIIEREHDGAKAHCGSRRLPSSRSSQYGFQATSHG